MWLVTSKPIKYKCYISNNIFFACVFFYYYYFLHKWSHIACIMMSSIIPSLSCVRGWQPRNTQRTRMALHDFIGGFRVTSSPPCWWTVNRRSLISSLCLSTSICSFHHCYLCLPRLHENHLLCAQCSDNCCMTSSVFTSKLSECEKNVGEIFPKSWFSFAKRRILSVPYNHIPRTYQIK